ncbi:MAG: RNA methyltransferase [Muribaculaceae bacterium]|nr:RNA methyltransferase [Muribaculaceae bacterium]MBQ7854079.1 RNA methyltransferase [Muribaculaceae bacterium]
MEKKTIWDLNRVSVEEYKSNIEKHPFVVVLDNIRSLNNVGSVFRTADAFLVEKIMLCGITATPPNNEIHKTALGAEDSVEWQYFESTIDCVNALKASGYTICCLEQVKDSVALQDFVVERGKKYAIVLGNEVNGVEQAVVDACDVCIEIPQCGTKHSLNVSVSGGIAIWHFFKALL